MSAFDDLLQEAADAGIQTEWIDRLRAASDGSPLRQELKTLKAQNGDLTETVTKYRNTTIGSHLTALGFTGNPAALNIPADLDPTDANKVTEWAVGMNLVQPPAPSEDDQRRQAELDGHHRVDQASAGGQPASGTDEKKQWVLEAATQQEFEQRLAEARAQGIRI